MICNSFPKCLTDKSYKCTNKKCRCKSKANNIVCEENGRRYNLINDRNLTVYNYLVDGGIYKNDALIKCDRLYVVIDNTAKNLFIFIELKGKSINHALDQIKQTVNRHRSLVNGSRVAFRVVCSGAPKIGSDSKAIELKKYLCKEFNSMPLIKENNLDEKYTSIK